MREPVVMDGCLNRLEPLALVEAFLNHPPVGFTPLAFSVENKVTPAFLAPFDILTTLDEEADWLRNLSRRLPMLDWIFRHRALFVGTTVSEYSIYGDHGRFTPLISRLLEAMHESRAELLIIKDIPSQSPLLPESDNQAASRLVEDCLASGFQIVSGQALAYVPIDFTDIEEYFQKISYSRRKDLRRKWRKRGEIEIEEIATGDRVFEREPFLRELYALYLNVFAQSEIQFDRFTFEFFASILNNPENGGVVFLFRRQGKIIGYNICFVVNDMLVDKYVGFAYPAARDANLYFISWLANLEWALEHSLKWYIAGWTDPEVKARLGARFTFTRHAVCLRNPILRMMLRTFRRFFESDMNWAQQEEAAEPGESGSMFDVRGRALSKT